ADVGGAEPRVDAREVMGQRVPAGHGQGGAGGGDDRGLGGGDRGGGDGEQDDPVPAAHRLVGEEGEDELLLVGVLGEEGGSGVGDHGDGHRQIGHQEDDGRPDAGLAGSAGGVLGLLGEVDRRFPAPVDEHTEQQRAGE